MACNTQSHLYIEHMTAYEHMYENMQIIFFFQRIAIITMSFFATGRLSLIIILRIKKQSPDHIKKSEANNPCRNVSISKFIKHRNQCKYFGKCGVLD